jgi:phenylalanyl-tRNA synthetase beta chain
MKISRNWLAELLPGVDLGQAVDVLTGVGLEVESVEEKGRELGGVLIAEVLGLRPHPSADKLRLVRIRAGGREEEVVCGAPNVPPPGNRVAWAAPGARLPGGRVMEPREVRGVLSPGMLASEPELGLGDRGDGILILSPDDPSGADLVQHAGIADDILEVNVTPNRPDALSHVGVAREIAASLGVELRLPPSLAVPTAGDVAALDVRIAEGAGCPRYLARFVTGAAVRPSPLAVRLRLSYCGARPISNLVDVTNYVLLELGHPLHAFDLDKLQGGIIVRRAVEGEAMTTLDGFDRRLVAGDIVIADERGPVALAGVMGGAASEVSAGTTRVLLEAATFDPTSIRRTSKRLGLSSEASYRFERGVDANGIPFAGRRAAELLAALGGGAVATQVVDRYPKPVLPREVRLSLRRLRRVSGIDFDVASARPELEKVAETVAVEGAGAEATLVATVPTYRPDLVGEEDLIEEVLRLGRHYAAPARPDLVLGNAAPAPSPEAPSDRARDRLAACGLHEIVTWGFVPASSLATIAVGDTRLRDGVVVKNPISADYEVMRTSLLVGLADALKRNLARGLEDVGLFEIGPIIQKPDGGGEPVQSEHAAAILTGRARGWLKPGEPLDFYAGKRVVETLLAGFGVEGSYEAPVGSPVAPVAPFLHPGASARVRLPDGRALGVVGELHPAVARKLGILPRTLYAELDVALLASARAPLRSVPPPRFPAIARDLSFWIEAATPAADQRAAFLAAGEALLREVSVLEDFRDPKYVPAGKKGMLWTMIYRADDRTLTDADADAAHARVVAALQGRFGIQIR